MSRWSGVLLAILMQLMLTLVLREAGGGGAKERGMGGVRGKGGGEMNDWWCHISVKTESVLPTLHNIARCCFRQKCFVRK